MINRLFVTICIFLTVTNSIYTQSKGLIGSLPIKNKNFEKLITSKKWDQLFPHRNKIYSYKAICKATCYFPDFLNSKDIILQKRELAAFLANIAQETSGGWEQAPGGYFKWGLFYVEEQIDQSIHYVDSSKLKFTPIKGVNYHGRGPKQLSWNYNYGQFSEAWFGTKDSLLKHPELVSSDEILCMASALWFWCYPQPPKPSCHQIMTETWKPTENDIKNGRLPGFGSTVNVINGGIECGKGKSFEKTKKRYEYYIYFCKFFDVSPGENISCENQLPFGI